MSDFNQAIKWLKEGKKVRRKGWNYHWYNSFTGVGDINVSNICNPISGQMDEETNSATTYLTIDNVEATDWEIYEEFFLTTINKGINAFVEKNTAVPNRVRLHSNAIKKLHIEDSVVEVLGLMIEIDDSLQENEAIVYYEKESLSDKRKEIAQEINQSQWGYSEKDAEEKIQNAQRRLNEEFEKAEKEYQRDGCKYCIENIIDKIFKEEFGDKLI